LSSSSVIKSFLYTIYFLDHQKLQKQINYSNPLGLKGSLAIEYAILMTKLWNGGFQSISPTKLQAIIGSKYPHFKGLQQQDAQEFMGSLLSLLHEDLNRIDKRPVLEPLECEGWSDSKIAEESWKRFLSRDHSIIVDNFFGQFKSKLTCPECNKVIRD
jgi:ubiquitin C-terminal hydrolase